MLAMDHHIARMTTSYAMIAMPATTHNTYYDNNTLIYPVFFEL